MISLDRIIRITTLPLAHSHRIEAMVAMIFRNNITIARVSNKAYSAPKRSNNHQTLIAIIPRILIIIRKVSNCRRGQETFMAITIIWTGKIIIILIGTVSTPNLLKTINKMNIGPKSKQKRQHMDSGVIICLAKAKMSRKK